jgi:hypothetical protein
MIPVRDAKRFFIRIPPLKIWMVFNRGMDGKANS